MGVTDPRKLIVILDDLEQELERWSVVAGDMLKTAQYTQNIRREALNRTWRRTRLATEQYHEDMAVYRARKQSVHDRVLACEDNVTSAKSLLQQAEAKLQEAKQVLQHWTGQLNQAIQWQNRAQNRLDRARAELAAAERALASAKSNLYSAEAAYQRCRNSYTTDSKGRRHSRDCSSYARAVEQARAEVNSAQNRVRTAQIEVNAAAAELERATKRVNACKQSVNLCQKGKNQAEISLDRARKALAQAERALDSAKAADRGVQIAGELVDEQGETVDEMNIQVQKAEDHLVEAQIHLDHSTSYEESAQRYRIMGRAELEYRTEVLYALNKPEMLEGVAAMSIASSAGDFAGSVSGGGLAAPARSAGNETEKDPTATGIWVTTNAVVPVGDLPEQPEYDDEKRQRKMPLERLKTELAYLKEIMPLVAEGIGTDADYWARRDEEDGNAPDAGMEAAYEAYYNPEKAIIIVELADKEYDVRRGAMRVWMAKQQGVDMLPVELMQQPAYATETYQFKDDNKTTWELNPYYEDDSFQIRLFNMSKREKLPANATDGDGICIDLVIEQDQSLVQAYVKRFDIENDFFNNGFAKRALSYAEKISQAHHATSIYMHQERAALKSSSRREWYKNAGYTLNREAQRVTIYKKLNTE